MTSIELLKDIEENYSWERAVFFKGYFETIKQDLDKLEKIEKIIEDYEKYKLKPYKPADDYIRQIKKEVLNNK